MLAAQGFKLLSQLHYQLYYCFILYINCPFFHFNIENFKFINMTFPTGKYVYHAHFSQCVLWRDNFSMDCPFMKMSVLFHCGVSSELKVFYRMYKLFSCRLRWCSSGRLPCSSCTFLFRFKNIHLICDTRQNFQSECGKVDDEMFKDIFCKKNLAYSRLTIRELEPHKNDNAPHHWLFIWLV
jgi:hypothetical protein